MEIIGKFIDDTLQWFVRIKVIMLLNHMFIHNIINEYKNAKRKPYYSKDLQTNSLKSTWCVCDDMDRSERKMEHYLPTEYIFIN